MVSSLIRKIALAGLIFASPVFFGCEEVEEDQEESSFKNGEVPEGCSDVKGTWYYDGTRRGGHHWSWKHLWLYQNGTNVQGDIQNEFYNSYRVKGSVSGNSISLKYTSPFTNLSDHVWEGTVNGDRMTLTEFFDFEGEGVDITTTYDRINSGYTNSALGVF